MWQHTISFFVRFSRKNPTYEHAWPSAGIAKSFFLPIPATPVEKTLDVHSGADKLIVEKALLSEVLIIIKVTSVRSKSAS